MERSAAHTTNTNISGWEAFALKCPGTQSKPLTLPTAPDMLSEELQLSDQIGTQKEYHKPTSGYQY